MTATAPTNGATRSAQSVRAFLESAGSRTAIVQAVIALVIATTATSRAAHHALTPIALAVLVGAWAAVLAGFGWPQAVLAGASALLDGTVVLDREPLGSTHWTPDHAAVAAARRYDATAGTDGFAPGPMWRAAATCTAVASAWALVGGGLVAAVLNGRQAGWVVVGAALAGLAGTSAVVVDVLGRRHGIAAAARVLTVAADPTPVRRRAWREVALPLAAVQMLVNGAATWVLFHSYHRPGSDLPSTTSTGHVLTSHVAMADVLTIVVILGFGFSALGTTWGRVDTTLGRLSFDPSADDAPSTSLGPQIVIYVGALGLVLAKLAQIVLPKAPNLVEVGVARGLLAAVMVGATLGFSYVRGAVNANATRRAGEVGPA